jgi:adenylate kinase family enzyme
MDRDIILINGAPGSHSTPLTKKLASEHYSQLFVEHISVNTIMRSLGRTALTTSNENMYDIISDVLTRHDSASLILLNDYPQHVSQVDDLYELAMLDNRRLSGLIIADNPKTDAIINIMGEHHTALTVSDAELILSDYHKRNDPVVLELQFRGLPLHFIDTSRPEADVIRDGVHTIQYLLSQDDIDKKNAS